MSTVLNPNHSQVDGLAFLGLSLARNHYYSRGEGKDGKEGTIDTNQDDDNNTKMGKLGHPDSYTHQTAFDLNQVIDRDYRYLQSTDDNGWLVGGGEAGPPTSYKLELKDSAHVEIMRIGTYRKDWGGLDINELLKVMASGSVLIPQIEALPTGVVPNSDTPPELEIRFDMEESSPVGKQLANLEKCDFEAFCKEPLPTNWQIRFLHNQFFKTFVFPSRFCPGPFHSTILRKADFRSDAHRSAYFGKCARALANWRREGPKPLNTIPRHPDSRPLSKEEIKALQAAKDAENNLEKFSAAIARQCSHDTDFVEPTEEEEDAVAELVDKLAAMGPLPPAATTAKATANLEVTLDEDNLSDEGDTTEIANGNEIAGAEPSEGDEVKAETTNDAAPEDVSNDVQVSAEAISEQVPTFKDADMAEEIEELPVGNDFAEGLSESPTDEAFATDSLSNSESWGMRPPPPYNTKEATAPEDCHSGIWLFTDRTKITHFFPPNFLPPYNTPEKRKIIFDVLKEEWDEGSLSWKPCGQGSMTKTKKNQEGNVIQMMSGVVSAVMNGVCLPKRSSWK